MSPFGAVLDSCVLIPAALRDTLLRAAQRGLYHPHWSDLILAEVERNLVKAGLTTAPQAQRLVATLRGAFPRAFVGGFESRILTMPNHPKDRHVLAAALQAEARTIITVNLRDFPQHLLAPYGVEAQSPDTFLLALYDTAPTIMAQIIEEQATALWKSAKTPADILDNLTGQTPLFAACMRSHF